DDESKADEELPDEGQAAAEIGADEVDQHRPGDRADERSPAAERHPDDELGAENEAGELRRDDVGEAGIGVSRGCADHRRDDEEQRLETGGGDTEILAALLVLAYRDEQPAGV